MPRARKKSTRGVTGESNNSPRAGMPAGSETLVSVRVGEKLITVKELGSTHYAGDETVYLSYPPKKVNVFDASTKRLIKYSR